MRTMTYRDVKREYDRKWIVYKTSDRPLRDESVLEILDSFNARKDAEQFRMDTPGDDAMPVGMIYVGFEPVYVGGLMIKSL